MASGRSRSRFTVRRTVGPERMSLAEWEAAERILARLVARAYAAEHPELFGPRLGEVLGHQVPGSSPTARADAVAPAASGGNPEKWSVEHHEKGTRGT